VSGSLTSGTASGPLACWPFSVSSSIVASEYVAQRGLIRAPAVVRLSHDVGCRTLVEGLRWPWKVGAFPSDRSESPTLVTSNPLSLGHGQHGGRGRTTGTCPTSSGTAHPAISRYGDLAVRCG
jgi:hypothetical protein